MAIKCIVVHPAVAVGPQRGSIVVVNDGAHVCYGKKGRRF